MITSIYVETTSGGMGDGWNDDQIANKRYAEWLESKLTSAFPDADVEVVAMNQTGGSNPTVISDNSSDEMLVHSFCQDAWGEFCGIVHEQFPELVAE